MEKAVPTIGSLELMHDLINLSSHPYPALSVGTANCRKLSGSLGARLLLTIVWNIFFTESTHMYLYLLLTDNATI